MTTWIALLRGVNIPSNRRVPMPVLRDLLVGLGHEDARTWIVSGNAWFPSRRTGGDRIAAEIEAALEERFGFLVAVVPRPAVRDCCVGDRRLNGGQPSAVASRCPRQ